MLLIELSGAKALSPSAQTRVRKAARTAIETAPKSHSLYQALRRDRWTLSIGFISSNQMQKLNAQYRKKDRPTDVLSFPLWKDQWAEPEERTLGEILICAPVARRQCQDFGNTFVQELERLAIHGALHVLDFDHERSPKDERIMQALEKRALRKLQR